MEKAYDIKDMAKRRMLVLDGAMGTMIQKRGLREEDFRGEIFAGHPVELTGNNDVLCLTAPDVIREIHEAYLDAGADIITTNSFNSNAFSQEAHGLSDRVRELCLAAAGIARRAADSAEKRDGRPRFVAGCLGPTGKTCSISPDISDPAKRDVYFDQMMEAYLESATALIEGGADLLLIETVFDTINCKAAIRAAERARAATGRSVPLMISVTVADASGRTLSGQTVEAFLISVSHAENLFSVGLNCSLGAEGMRPWLEELALAAPFRVSVHPNAGLPNEFGEYIQTPETMAKTIAEFAEAGLVNIVGGCCGTTPAHIAAIADAVSGAVPRAPAEKPGYCRLSGLEPLDIRPEMNFVNIGERTNVAGSRKFLRLVKEEKFEEAAAVAREQVENGARIIDVNVDDGMIDGPAAMSRFLDMIGSDPEIARVPVMIDSSDFDVVEEGLKHLQGRGIVNSISLKEGEEKFLEKAVAIRRMGAATLVMAFDEKGQADTFDRRVEICERAYKLLVEKAGYVPSDIVMDPNVFAIATGMPEHDSHARDFIDAVAEIKKRCPGALVSGGISNVSFSFRGNDAIRGAIHAVFLYHAIANGLDMGIVNPAHLTVYDEIPEDLREIVEDAVLNRRPGASERLMEVAEKFAAEADGGKSREDPEWRSAPPHDRIFHAMLKGEDKYIVEDVEERMGELGSAVGVIESSLMDAMRHIGDLFGEGKMFLPQVVKSARVMRKAVDYLTPFIEKERGSGGEPNGKVLLATVKGDVHDIGKNIVSVVLKCDNIEVVDLGVMTPCEEILDTAEAENVDIIGLSGLITPSLDEMARVAAEMERRGMDIPLLIGGAATSEAHTRAKIAPNRSKGVCVHAGDASKAVSIVNALFNPKSAAELAERIVRDRAAAADRAGKRKTADIVPLEEARRSRLRIDWRKEPPPKPARTGIETFSPSIEELSEFIDWRPFLMLWELKGRFPKALEKSDSGNEMAKVLADARKLLKKIADAGAIEAKGVAAILPAHSEGDDIVARTPDGGTARIETLRQQNKKKNGSPNLALADFIAPEGMGDHIGVFVVTAGLGSRELAKKFADGGDDYSSIMAMGLADRLAEAFSEYLHFIVRKDFWGYAPDENLTAKEIFQRKYRGIRPAPGYPACPDHYGKRVIFDILDAERRVGVKLTESSAMEPPASVAGFIFAHPKSDYFSIASIGMDQLEDLASRRGVSKEEARRLLGAVSVID